ECELETSGGKVAHTHTHTAAITTNTLSRACDYFDRLNTCWNCWNFHARSSMQMCTFVFLKPKIWPCFPFPVPGMKRGLVMAECTSHSCPRVLAGPRGLR